MTNLEALQAALSPISYESITAEKAMLDNDIVGTAQYSKSNTASIDRTALAVLETLLSTSDVSEGDLSIKYDRSAIMKRIDMINSRLSVASASVPKITNKSHLW